MTKVVKQKKCKACSNKFTPYSSLQKWCSPECGLILAKQIQKKKADKEHIGRKRDYRLNDKSIQKVAAQKAFNAYIRERDKRYGCISCSKPVDWIGQWHAGHFKTVGARPDLRFNENNCAKQCSVCNNHFSGNLVEYRRNLIERIGQASVEKLETEAEPKRYTAEDYRRIAKEYRDKLKQLQQTK